MIIFAVGNLEIKLQVVCDSFSSKGVEWKNMEIDRCFLSSVTF